MSTGFLLFGKGHQLHLCPTRQQSDLHILGTEMLHRGVRRAPNMTNDWLHNVFDCSAVCWHFTNGWESVCVCVRAPVCVRVRRRSDSSLLICRPTVHTNTGTHLHSNWSVTLFSLTDPETLWTCVSDFISVWVQLSFMKAWVQQRYRLASQEINHTQLL